MKEKKSQQQLLRYMSAGAIATSIDTSLFILLASYAKIEYHIALFISFSTGSFINFMLCSFFVFPAVISWKLALIKHYSSSFISCILQQLLMTGIISLFNIKALLISRLTIAACTFIFNFSMLKYFAFKS